jgi:hypothetical protein
MEGVEASSERIVLGFGSGAAHLKTAVEASLVTERGLRRLGAGEVASGGSKTPGVAAPMAVALARGPPIGLFVRGAAKVGGEVTGHRRIAGAAKRAATAIAVQRRVAGQKQGWI